MSLVLQFPIEGVRTLVTAQDHVDSGQRRLLWVRDGNGTYITTDERAAAVHARGFEPGTARLLARTSRFLGTEPFVRALPLAPTLVEDLGRDDCTALLIRVDAAGFQASAQVSGRTPAVAR